MNIEIIKGAPTPGRDYDSVVLIDVFRASSTMVCLLASGVREIALASTFEDIPPGTSAVGADVSHVEYFSDTEHALRTKDNSPVDALALDGTVLSRAVIVSRNGTKVPSWVRSCNELIVCSFLNLGAVARHIEARPPRDVAIIAIGHIKVPEEAEEDNLCAYALRDLLTGVPLNEPSLRTALKARIDETRRDPNAPQGVRIEIDRAISCGISLFDVVPVINKQGNGYIVEASASSLISHIDRPTFTAAGARTLGEELNRFHQLAVPEDATPLELPADVSAAYQWQPDGGGLALMAGKPDAAGRWEYRYPFREPFGRPIYGPREWDLAELFAALLLSSGGSVHRALNTCRAFFEGYATSYQYELFFRLLVSTLTACLNNDRQLKPFYREHRSRLLTLLNEFGGQAAVEPRTLIRQLCETTNNNGKLDGRVSARQEIVYQKREGNELSINLTNRCPNACLFCIRDFSPGWHQPKSTEAPSNLYLASEPNADEIIEALRAELDGRDGTTVQVLKFCGYGEPLLRPDAICEVSERIKSEYSNLRIQINTTGWPYYKHCLDAGYPLSRFKEAGVEIFSVSLNAPTEKLYNSLTRPGVYEVESTAFTRTLEFISASVEQGFETKVTAVAVPKLTQALIGDFNALVTGLGATTIVRNFVGREEALSLDTFGIEVEAKIFEIDRNRIREVLARKRARLLGSGLTEIVVYDIPADVARRHRLREVIEANAPEHRRFFLLLKELSEKAATTDTLADSLGFLRLMSDYSGTRVIYREPTSITTSTKREKELAYKLDSVDIGVSLLEGLGLAATRRQQKCRESYELNDVRYHLDTWPGMDTYLKVEAFDDVAIYRGVTEIDCDPRLMRGEHAERLFRESGVDPTDLRFSGAELSELGLAGA